MTVGLEDGSGSAAVKTRAWFWGIGEGEGRGVDDSVVADQGDGDLDGLTDPAPPLSEGRDVRHHAEHALSTPGTEGVRQKDRFTTRSGTLWSPVRVTTETDSTACHQSSVSRSLT